VAEYIDYRIRAVGGPPQLFTAQASDTISEASAGVPRTINILCDTALVYGFAAGANCIGLDVIRMMIKDKLQYGIFSSQHPN
jgi:type II secretory pathway predicted ATPase ExeA